jgi:predicted nucleic acid-binding protein
MKKEILFLDANILFSAAYRENSGLLRLWKIKSVNLVSSAYAVEEARRNLDISFQKERLDKLLTRLTQILPYHVDIDLPRGVEIREKDKPILLSAISGKADFLITGDVRDFGKFYGQKIGGVTILPPSEYLKKYHINKENKTA